MIEFIMLVGLPGCGKSTLSGKMDYTIISSDKIRLEMYGNENVQTDPEKVFSEARKRIIRCLNSGISAVLDATNVKRKERIRFLKDIKSQVKPNLDIKYKALWVAVPYNTVIERNKSRFRVVPTEVIRKMYLNFTPPGIDEGFDEIGIDFADSTYDDYQIGTFLEMADDFDQKNHHHTLTLGGHCRKAAKYVQQNSDSQLLYDVAMLHDCGKPFTHAPKLDKEGKDTGECSYHQHHCTGSYDSVFYLKNLGYSDQECIYGARLIWWHMRPLLEWKNEKTKKKDKEILEEKFYIDLNILHDGDVNAH